MVRVGNKEEHISGRGNNMREDPEVGVRRIHHLKGIHRFAVMQARGGDTKWVEGREEYIVLLNSVNFNYCVTEANKIF